MQQYKIEDGSLFVLKDLRQDFDLSFDQACRELLTSDKDQLEIHLGQVSYVNSTYIGMIAATFFQAQALGKILVVRGKSSVLQIFKAAGFEGFIQMEEL